MKPLPSQSQKGLKCSVPGCGGPAAVIRGGLAQHHCRQHVLHKARHGSHWHPTYPAAELRPYTRAASSWLIANRANVDVGAAIQDLNHVLAFAGRVDPAMNLRGKPATYRAKIAFARLREAGVGAE